MEPKKEQVKQALYASPDPYPPLAVGEKNMRYAQILKMNLASQKSEMTAITQYLYQSWVWGGEYREIAEAMHKIAAVEMRHLDLFGKAVLLLGGNPTYSAPQRNGFYVWNGNAVNYGGNISRMLRYNLQSEQETIRAYTKQSETVLAGNIPNLLKRIIEDEKVHVSIFQGLLEKISE